MRKKSGESIAIEPLLSENLAQLAFERLEHSIMSGVLSPGEQISEAHLARALGISRGPLREALGRLEGLGLVTRVANQGPHVTALDEKELIDLMVLREAVEGMASRYAALNATPAEVRRLQKLLDQHEKDPGILSGVGYVQGKGDLDFHFGIAEASRNSRLLGFLSGPLYSIMRLYRHRLGATPGRPLKALAEHRSIFEAIAARDPERAEEEMRRHIRSSRENVQLALSNQAKDAKSQAIRSK